MTQILAVLVAATLTFIALLHIAWGHGRTWPATSRQALLALVIPENPPRSSSGPRFPGRAPCYAVAGALITAAALVLTAGRTSLSFATWGAWAAGGVFALRGVLGFFYQMLFPAQATTPFARMNLRYYSPLCVVLATMIACILTFK